MKLAVALGAALCGCGVEPAAPVPRTGFAGRDSIVNGTREPQNTVLTPGQILAVGYVSDPSGEPLCSAVLIDARVAATARHCIVGEHAASLRFGMGEDPGSPAALLDVAAIRRHPRADAALVFLAAPARDAVPTVEPIALNRAAVGPEWLGRWVDAGGYGDTHSSATGRNFASVQIDDYDDATLTVDGHQLQGLCYGDSGAPVVWQDGRRPDRAPVVVGLEQSGEASCVGRDQLTRADVVAPWADAEIALDPEPDPSPVPCGEIDTAGECDGDVSRWCQRDVLSEETCLDGCGDLGPLVGFRCLPSSCAGLDNRGRCDGEVRVWCTAYSGLTALDCAAEGDLCTQLDDGRYDCAPPPSRDCASDACEAAAGCGAAPASQSALVVVLALVGRRWAGARRPP